MSLKIIVLYQFLLTILVWQIAFLGSSSFIPFAFAAPVTTDYLFGGNETNAQRLSEISGLGVQDPRETIAKVINITLAFLGVIAVVLILIAGLLWMTAAGNEEKIATAKKLMAGGVIGLVIVLAAFGIAKFVISSLIDATGAGSGSSSGSAIQTAQTQSPTSLSSNPTAGNLNSNNNSALGGVLSSETDIITPGNIATEQIIAAVEISLVP